MSLLFGKKLTKKVLEVQQRTDEVTEKIKRCQGGVEDLSDALGLGDPEKAAKWQSAMGRVDEVKGHFDLAESKLEAAERQAAKLKAVCGGSSSERRRDLTNRAAKMVQEQDVSRVYDLLESHLKVFGNLDLIRRLSESHYDLLRAEEREIGDAEFAETRSELMDLLLHHARQQASVEASSDANAQKDQRELGRKLKAAEKKASEETVRADEQARLARKAREEASRTQSRAESKRADLDREHKAQLMKKAHEIQRLEEEVAHWQRKAEDGVAGIREDLTQKLNAVGQPDSQAFDEGSPIQDEARVADLESEVEKLQASLKKAESDLEEATKDYNKKWAEMSRATNRANKIITDSKSEFGKRHELESELEATVAQCKKYKATADLHWDALCSTKGHLKAANARLAQLTENDDVPGSHSRSMANKKNKTLQEEVATCKARLSEYADEVSGLKVELAEATEKLDNLESLVTELRAEAKLSSRKLESEQCSSSNLSSNLADIKEQLDDLVGIEADLRGLLRCTNESLETMKATSNAQTTEISDLNEVAGLREKKIAALDAEIQQAHQRTAKAESHATEAEQRATIAAAQVAAAQAISDSRQSRLVACGNERDALRSKLDACEKARDAANGSVETSAKEIADALTARGVLEKELIESRDGMARLQDVLDATEDALAEARFSLKCQTRRRASREARLVVAGGMLRWRNERLSRDLTQSRQGMTRATGVLVDLCGHEWLGYCLVNSPPIQAGPGTFVPWEQLTPWTQDGPCTDMITTCSFPSAICELGHLLTAHPCSRQGQIQSLLSVLTHHLLNSRQVVPGLIISVLQLVSNQYFASSAVEFEAWQLASTLDDGWSLSSVELVSERNAATSTLGHVFGRMAGDAAALRDWCASDSSVVYDATTDRALLTPGNGVACMTMDLRNRQVRWGGIVTYDGLEVRVQGHDVQDLLVMPLEAGWDWWARYTAAYME